MLGGVILKSIVLLAVVSAVTAKPVSVSTTFAKNTSKCEGYSATKVATTRYGLVADLKLIGAACDAYGIDYHELTLQVTYEENDRLHVKIFDKYQQAWQTPESIVPRATGHGARRPALKFEYTSHPFSFKVLRSENHEVLFDTTGTKLIFEDQYLELTSALPKGHNVYGLGEQVDTFKRAAGTITTMWARDAADPVRENVYGSHPFYVELRKGTAHGVLLLNNHGMDVYLNETSITYKTLGGVLDYYFFAGAAPNTVVEQYTDLIGKPTMWPYWALGFHQCRYGYTSIWEVEAVIANYTKANIPLETMWTDIDYMDGFKDFTTDPVLFPEHEMRRVIDNLHKNNQHYVLILDPAIGRNESYEPYLEGLKEDVFLKNRDGSVYYGQVWPGYTAFPDWFAPNAQKWWSRNIGKFLGKLPLDGLWIDMNEASSFCFGSCGTGVDPSVIPALPWTLPTDIQPKDPIYAPGDPDFNILNPPYEIHNSQGNLSDHALATNATHHGGITEYIAHNLYGHMEGYATRQAVLQHYPGKRPFVLGRSTFPGSGVNEGKWTGDNNADWNYIYYSIPGILSMNLFGIPYVGADICGFNSDTTEQLCNRWMSLGAFYTFMRNHAVKGSVPHEAYRWESVADASRYAIGIRYSLMPYLYTLFQKSSVTGTPILQALSFGFPSDTKTYAIDTQFLFGPAVLITPVLTENATTVEGYFPSGVWYAWDSLFGKTGLHDIIKGPQHVNLQAPISFIPVHILGGNVLAAQWPGYTTTASRKNPFYLIVALDEMGEASGSLYLDDGENLRQERTSDITFTVQNGVLRTHGKFEYKVGQWVDKIIVASPRGLKTYNVKLSLNNQITFYFH